MNEKIVIITDRFDQNSYLFLINQPGLKVIRSESPIHIGIENLSQAHALLIRSRTQITEDLLQKAQNLELIISSTSGFDHIDLNATKKWGVTVMNTPNAHIESASQLTWSLILTCAHQLTACHRLIQSGHWSRNSVTGIELNQRTLGIVGLGRIGSRVASIGQAFGMKVIAFDPYVDELKFEENSVERMSYEELLKVADVISFHVPKTKETIGMLNRSHFEYIRRGVILINSSRGGVINENDLYEALNQGWVHSVGLDVFEKEPLPIDSRLFQRSSDPKSSIYGRVVLTPHIGANTDEAFYKSSQLAADKLIRFFTDSSTSDTLPPQTSWYRSDLPHSRI